MQLLQALEVDSADELDPTRPLPLGPFELGIEATVEAIRILEGGDYPGNPELRACAFQKPTYWSIRHATSGEAELFGFPQGLTGGLTTAMEIALVRAIAASEPNQHATILDGGAEIVLGSPTAYRGFKSYLPL